MIYTGSEIAAGLYLIAALIGLIMRRREQGLRFVVWLLGIGSLFHTLGFVGLHFHEPPIPLASFPAAITLMAWLIVVAYLLSLRFARVRRMGAWIAAVSGVLTTLAEVGLAFFPPEVLAVADNGAWPHAHVLLSAAGFSFLALASFAGIAYLVKQRELKSKRPVGVPLPSLESMDRAEHLALSLGYPLLTLGVITGFGWESSRGLERWTGHAIWLLAAWFVYLIPMTRRVIRRERGRRVARSVVACFLFLAFSYIGVRLMGMLG